MLHPYFQLQHEVESLRKERDAALTLAATRQAEANTWRTRYEQLKPQLAESSAQNAQLVDAMRRELVRFVDSQPAATCPVTRWSDSVQVCQRKWFHMAQRG